ncbi:SspB family protein [Brevundimonas sp. VNH65]|uniref:SspB family protein n=1 Tax=Brevundimonas sp. VNH65 TaxID=3400917 RepID=UPI003BFB3EEC
MADEPADLMDYGALEQEALRSVVRLALERAALPDGLPGDHHFYITFKTRAPGVTIPPDLLARFRDDMTIVLQNQYWDLAVEPGLFTVMLKFGGVPKVLTIPYSAITRFHDRGVDYVLDFDPPEIAPEPVLSLAPEPAKAAPSVEDGGDDDVPKVVSLDQFRKK